MKLSEFVKMHNVPAKKIAEVTGLSTPTIISYIDEIRIPSVDNAFKIEIATFGIVKASDFISNRETIAKNVARKAKKVQKKKTATKRPS